MVKNERRPIATIEKTDRFLSPGELIGASPAGLFLRIDDFKKRGGEFEFAGIERQFELAVPERCRNRFGADSVEVQPLSWKTDGLPG